jgi:iron complex outermembrane receptor protein
LRDSGIQSAQDLQLLTPGLVFDNTGQQSNIYLRGIGTFGVGNGLDPAVAVYTDDLYLPNSTTAQNAGLLDVDRVEVLKGPQGTLFGRNVTGGALRIITNGVSKDFEGYADVTYGNYDTRILQGAVNVPITSDFGVRVAALSNQRDGYSINLDPAGARDWNNSDLQQVRGRARWDITDSVTSNLILDYWTRADLNGVAQVVLGNPALTSGTLVPGSIYSTKNGYVGSAITKGDPQSHEFSAQWRNDVSGQWFNFASITTWVNSKIGEVDDVDATNQRIIDLYGTEKLDAFSQEFQVLSPTENKKLEWLVGLNYYNSSDQWHTVLDIGLPFLLSTGTETIHTTALGVFGTATYHFTDQLSLTAGARWSDEQKDMSLIRGDEIFYPAPANYAVQNHWDNTSPMASVKYKSDYGVLYATYSKAYQSGGFDYPYSPGEPKIDPEYLTSYEVGFKGNFWGGRIVPNLSAFHYDYKNLQVASQEPTGPPGGYTTNAAKATVDGVELQVAARLAQWLTVDAGGAWTDGKYNRYPGAVSAENTQDYPNVTFDASGYRMVFLPKWTYFVQLNSNFQLGEGKLHGLLTWSWKSDYDLAVGGTGGTSGSSGIAGLTQPAFGLLNARIGYLLPGERWDIALWGTNLLNKEYLAFGHPGVGTFGAPRTYGLEVRFTF